jgi:hypothetical protein
VNGICGDTRWFIHLGNLFLFFLKCLGEYAEATRIYEILPVEARDSLFMTLGFACYGKSKKWDEMVEIWNAYDTKFEVDVNLYNLAI